MIVEVVSIQAALHGRERITWRGDVPRLGGTPERVNEDVFRFFNRVDEADAERLSKLGYEMPSLSVGDLVAWGSQTWRVAGNGFELVTGDFDLLKWALI